MTEFDYSASKAYCEKIGLKWLGDDYEGLLSADKDAKAFGMKQEHVDAMMRHHLWQVKILFSPKAYKFWTRIKLAVHFLKG